MNDVRPYLNISKYNKKHLFMPYIYIYCNQSINECNKHSEKNFSQFAFNYKSKKLTSLCQKVVHRSGTYAVKIRHHNCLLQVKHVKVLYLKITFSLTKKRGVGAEKKRHPQNKTKSLPTTYAPPPLPPPATPPSKVWLFMCLSTT